MKETGINSNAMVPPLLKHSDEKLCYHFLETEQSEDMLIYSDFENPSFMFRAAVTPDGGWLRMVISKDTDPVNQFWLGKLDGNSLPANGGLLTMSS